MSSACPPLLGISASFIFRGYGDLVVDGVRLDDIEQGDFGYTLEEFVKRASLPSLLRALAEAFADPSLFEPEFSGITDGDGSSVGLLDSERPACFPVLPASRILPMIGLFLSAVVVEIEKPGFVDVPSINSSATMPSAGLLFSFGERIRARVLERSEDLVFHLVDWVNFLTNSYDFDKAFSWEVPCLLRHFILDALVCEVVANSSGELYLCSETIIDYGVRMNLARLNSEKGSFSLTEMASFGALNLNPGVPSELEGIFALPGMSEYRLVSCALPGGAPLRGFHYGCSELMDYVPTSEYDRGSVGALLPTTIDHTRKYGNLPIFYKGGDEVPVFALSSD